MLKAEYIVYLCIYMDGHQLYLLEQHSDSLEIWSTIIRIKTEGKSLIMKLCPDTTLGHI